MGSCFGTIHANVGEMGQAVSKEENLKCSFCFPEKSWCAFLSVHKNEFSSCMCELHLFAHPKALNPAQVQRGDIALTKIINY